MKKVMIFGTFDGIHKGHEFLILEAKKISKSIVISLAGDDTVKQYKNKMPKYSFEERKRMLLKKMPISKIIESDKVQGAFLTVLTIKPDVIMLGYDQDALKNSLLEWLKKTKSKIKIVNCKPYNPQKYKTSLLNV